MHGGGGVEAGEQAPGRLRRVDIRGRIASNKRSLTGRDDDANLTVQIPVGEMRQRLGKSRPTDMGSQARTDIGEIRKIGAHRKPKLPARTRRLHARWTLGAYPREYA